MRDTEIFVRRYIDEKWSAKADKHDAITCFWSALMSEELQSDIVAAIRHYAVNKQRHKLTSDILKLTRNKNIICS